MFPDSSFILLMMALYFFETLLKSCFDKTSSSSAFFEISEIDIEPFCTNNLVSLALFIFSWVSGFEECVATSFIFPKILPQRPVGFVATAFVLETNSSGCCSNFTAG